MIPAFFVLGYALPTHNLKNAARALALYQEYGFKSRDELDAAITAARNPTDCIPSSFVIIILCFFIGVLLLHKQKKGILNTLVSGIPFSLSLRFSIDKL